MTSGEDLDLTLEIDENGAVRPLSKLAARRLAASTGLWNVVPSLRDLLVLERVTDATEPAGQLVLCGVIDGSGSFANFLGYVHFSALDGSLTILSGKTRKQLYFRRGQLLAATSNLPEDRLGALLVRYGLLREADLVAAIREITPTRRLGTVLVEKGVLTSHALYEGVVRQAQEIFYSALLLRRGEFYLTRLSPDTPLPARLQLDTQILVLEGLRRIDEMSYFRAKLPSSDVVLGRRVPAPSGTLDGPARAVYELVDGARTLTEIARETRLGEFGVTRAAFELLQTGFVELRVPTEIRRQPVPDAELPADATSTIVEAYNGALARLYEVLSAKGQATSLRQGVQAFLGGSARYAALFQGIGLGDDGTLCAAALAANLHSEPEATRLDLLQRGLNELLFFVLFVAGDAIDHAEEQELHAGVARALGRLITGS